MIQGIVSKSFGFHAARHVSYVRLRGWFGPLHMAMVYSYFVFTQMIESDVKDAVAEMFPPGVLFSKELIPLKYLHRQLRN